MTLPTSPTAELTADNLRAIVRDIGQGAGWHSSTLLYSWYCGMVREAGLEPISQNMFGRQMRALGYRSSIQRMNEKHQRCWFISKKAWRADSEVSKAEE